MRGRAGWEIVPWWGEVSWMVRCEVCGWRFFDVCYGFTER
ncbi:hypothetical protein SGRIM119S_04558 [Streptomyces griseorubiginosus]